MTRNADDHADAPAPTLHFVLGLIAGTFVGAGLMMWIAPKAVAEAQRAVTDSANMFRDDAVEQYSKIGRRVGAAVDDLAAKGLDARADAADAVARGAHEVERIAVAASAIPPKQL